MPALLFGSISTLADTSELQRQAYNDAFAQHGLDWRWDRDAYVQMLTTNGGHDRVAHYAAARGETVDAAAVHATKSALFQQSVRAAAPRPGVVETVRAARAAGFQLGLVTATSAANVTALLEALGPDLAREVFDVVVTSADVDEAKPDPAAYLFALAGLGQDPAGCVAVEDNVGGLKAAADAGVACFAFPNVNTAAHNFGSAPQSTDALSFETLVGLLPPA